MNLLTTAFHFILVAHYSYGIYVYLLHLNPPPEIAAARAMYGGPFKYLTFIDMLLQCAYFTLAFINDCFGSDTRDFKKAKMLRKTRDFLFTTIIFSIGAFVTVTFWVLWHIDRDLIYPEIYDTFFPNWLNHNIHTAPLLGVLLELWICPHAFPSPRNGFLTIFIAIALYGLWLCFIAFKTSVWVYPILQKLSIVGRVAFMIGMAILVCIFYVTEETLNAKFWGSTTKKNFLKEN